MNDDLRKYMNIILREDKEQTDNLAQHQQIAAIAQLIADKTKDKNSQSKLSMEAFNNMLNKMGIPMTPESIMDLVQNGKLDSVIKDANEDEIVFKGQDEIDSDEMDVDKAKDIVKNMAKKSAKKGIHNKPKAKPNLEAESVEESDEEPTKTDSIYGKGIY